MQKLLLFTAFIFPAIFINAQTFNGATGTIPPGPSSMPTCFSVTVTGVGNINAGVKGLSSVCLNITHPYTDELEILLKAPDGTLVPLSIQNGGSGDNYTGTCFTTTATSSIKFAPAPFTGNYLPEGYLGAVNNGQNADGTWSLCIRDRKTVANEGVLVSWSLTFSNTPAPLPPVMPNCSRTIPSTSDCASATSVCDFSGLCGSTTGTTSTTWSGSGLTACFGLENISFIKFIAGANTATFTIWVPVNTAGPMGGMQMIFFSGTCNSGAVTTYGCYPHIYPYSDPAIPLPTVVTANGLTIGNTYYLMADGYNGDQCSYRIEANSGVNVLKITPAAPAVCRGQSINLVASGSDGPYSWSPAAGLNITSGAAVTVNTDTTITYTINSTTTTGCNLIKDVTVTVNSLPVITIHPSTDTQRICQNSPAAPLSVAATAGSGAISGYQWYITTAPSNTGGTMIPSATSSAYTPSSFSTGTIYFYCKVTNSNGCSVFSDVSAPVIISPLTATPAATATMQPTCLAPAGTIVATSPVGADIQYSVGGAYQAGGTFTGLSPATYNVTAKNMITGCISNAWAVTINPISGGPSTPLASVTVPPTCVMPTATIAISSPTGVNINYSVGGAYQAGNTFSGLTNGTTYKITAKDITSGCVSDTFSLAVSMIPGAPAQPTASVTTEPDCTTSTGTITVSAPAGSTIEYSAGNAYQVSGIFAGLTPGTTYSVTAKDVSSGCVSAPLNITIGPISPVAAPVVSNVNYCQNAAAIALTAAGINLLWYTTSSGGTGSSIAPVPSTSTTGSRDYYVSQAIGACESPRSQITVTVGTQPLAPGVSSPVAYCQNAATAQLTATGTSLSWYSAMSGGTGANTAPAPVSTTAGNTDYYVSQSVNGCESPRSAITVTINAAPTLPAVTSTIDFCQNATAGVLNATGSNLLWYSSASGGAGSATAPAPATIAPGITSYYVSQTVNGCESSRASIAVTVSSRPAPPAVISPVAYCQNSTPVALTAAGNDLLWYNTASGGVGASSAPVPSLSVTGDVIYYVSQTVNACEGARSMLTVTVIPGTAEPEVISPVIYCQNTTAVPLTATGSNLLWYVSGTAVTGISTAPAPSTVIPGNTFYYVTQTVNGCESPRRAITVTVNVESTAVPGFRYNPETICINGNNPGPAYDLGFTNGGTFTATPAGININPSTGNVNLVNSTAGSYIVTYTYNTTGCINGASASAPIIINPAVSTVTVFSYASPVCKNSTDPGPNMATNFTVGGLFSSRSGLAINNQTGVIDIANSLPGTYQVTYSLNALGCRLATSNFSFVTIIDTASPVTAFRYSPDNICINSGNPTLETAMGFTSEGGFFSSNPAGLNIDELTGEVNTGLSVPGNYNITYTVPPLVCRLGGSYTSNLIIKGYAPPVTGFSYFSPVCKSDVNAIPVPATNFFEGGIFSSTTGLFVDASSGIVDLTQSAAGDYIIKYNVAQGVCNPAGSGSTPFTILSQPEQPVVTSRVSCGPGVFDLSASASGTISWYAEPELLNQINVGNNFTTQLDNTTTYYLTNTVGTCFSKAAAITATVNPVPTAPFLGNDTTICNTDKIILNATGPYNKYIWQDGSVQPTFTVSNTGNYTVTVSTGTGCDASGNIHVEVMDNCDDIIFPSGFSPNGDGLNDKFGALGNLVLIKNYSLKIFNRYGEIVFSTTDPYDKWNGMVKGKLRGAASYVWVAAYIYHGRVAKIQKGNITVVQ